MLASGFPEGDRNAIYVVDAATGDARPVTRKVRRLDKADHDPSWSPDGAKIVFGKFTKLTRRTVKADLYVVNSDGTQRRRLIRNALMPDWGRQP